MFSEWVMFFFRLGMVIAASFLAGLLVFAFCELTGIPDGAGSATYTRGFVAGAGTIWVVYK